MATKADKKRWDDLHAAYAKAAEALQEYEIELGVKYGHRFDRTWLSTGQRNKLDKLRERRDKIGEKIIDLIVRVSPRGDTWLHGVPSFWLREELTWEDVIRPKDEPLSVVVPGAYGYPDGYMKASRKKERHVKMPRGIHTDAEHFHDLLEKGVILKKDRVEGDTIDLGDDEPVRVGIVVNVTGYGPHVGAMYVMQRGSPDEALQEAFEILEQWELDNNQEHFQELEQEYGDDAMSVFTETFDGWAFKLSPYEFADAISGTEAEQFVDIEPEEEEGGEEMREGDSEEPPVIRISFTRLTPSDEDEYPEEEHGWIDEDGVEIEADEDEDVVEQAVKFLKREGATEPSSSHFHKGVWYSTGYETIDYGTGEEEERSFHLDGFSPEEEAEIFKAIQGRR